MMLTKFGEKLRIMLIQQNTLLKNLADKIGCSPSYLSNIQRGKTAISKELIKKIGNALSLPQAQLDELQELAKQSGKEIKMALTKDRNDNEMISMFARNFTGLTQAKKQQIRDILKDGCK